MTPTSPTSSTSSSVCRLCGRTVFQIQGYLHRVNEKGVAGIWECRPSCTSKLSQDEALLAAIEGPITEKSPTSPAPEWALEAARALYPSCQDPFWSQQARIIAQHAPAPSPAVSALLRAAVAVVAYPCKETRNSLNTAARAYAASVAEPDMVKEAGK